MNLKKELFKFCCTILFILTILISSQAQNSQETKIISAGIVNGKAISLPAPEYSGNAFKLGVPGKIDVKVLIDENGNVISAETIRGIEDLSIRKACETAAMKAKFSPTTLFGRPVKVTGVIVYNFVDTRTNEEKLKIFSVGTFITLTRSFTSDAEIKLFEESFGMKEMFAGNPSELAEFTDELAPFSNLESLPYAKRLEAIDNSSALILKKLNTTEAWQFEVGKAFGAILGELMKSQILSSDNPDPSKLNKETIKQSSLKLKDLLKSASSDFSPDISAKLLDVAVSGEKNEFNNAEDLNETFRKILIFIEVVSPESNQSTN